MNSSWTLLSESLDIARLITREVLTEKYCLAKTKQIELNNFLISKLQNCLIYKNKDSLFNFIFAKYNDGILDVLIEVEGENEMIIVQDTNFKEILTDFYDMNDEEISDFFSLKIEQLFDVKNYNVEFADWV